MIDNLVLFNDSLNNPEPLVDDFYVKKGELIISKDYKKANKLMEVNRDLINNITAFEVAQKNGNLVMQNQIIIDIQKFMNTKDINYTEFASFWAIIDVSYSEYRALTNSEQLIFLKQAIKKYLNMRHNLYLDYGYSITTLQVGKDAKSHKSSGQLGINKCAFLLEKFNFKRLDDLNLNDFNSKDNIYIFTDKSGKKLFKSIISNYNLEFLWSVGRQNKMPDILFKKNSDFFIVEHKHMKEGGGGQDKQVTEIINFIDYNEKIKTINIHYITFLDGLYFNLFSKINSGTDTKVKNQLLKIKSTLKNNPQNFFVNTYGFVKLLESIC